MQAVILAAGMGKRLGGLTQNNTKCMIKVNNQTLIDRVLSQLSKLSLSRIVIVVGYEGEKLRQYLSEKFGQMHIEFITNDIYYRTNNIYSLYLAKEVLLQDDTLLLESDLIFEDSVLAKLIDNPYPDLALVDKYESWMDGTVVTIDDNRNIKQFLGKDKFCYEDIPSYYKTVNIYKFSKEFSATHYVPFLEAYCKALGDNEYYEQVLKVITMLDNPSIKALPLQGEKWYEIDDIQDLEIAESIFTDTIDEQLSKVTKRYGGFWRYPKMLDFCYLVNPYFPTPRMIDEIKANFETLLREYPSGMDVNSLLCAKYFNVDKANVVVGNGAAELIKDFVENCVGNLGMVLPTFEEYPNRMKSGNIVPFKPQNDSYAYTAQDLMNFFDDKPIDALLVINPDNPSGNYIPFGELQKLIAWAGQKGIKLVIDESFVDFADVEGDKTLLQKSILKDNRHLIVIKSISKSYGVPGLRLGALASGDEQLVADVKKRVAIWNINSFAEFYMQIFGKYEKDYQQSCRVFIDERNRFKAELDKMPFLRVVPSQANYFLCEVTGKYSSTELTKILLSKFNILIKDAKSKTDGRNFIRIAVRDKKDNNMLIEALLAI